MTDFDSNFYRKPPKPDKEQIKRVVPTQETKETTLDKIIDLAKAFIKLFGK